MTDQLIAEAVGELDRYDVANAGLFDIKVDSAVAVGSLEPSVTDEFGETVVLLYTIDDDLGGLPTCEAVAAKPRASARSRAFWARSSLTSSST